MDTILIIGIVVAVLILFIILLYNGLIRLRNQVRNSFAQIDVQLKRRNDLIPNLVESVKGYMKHEKGVLTEITKARSSLMNAQGVEKKSSSFKPINWRIENPFCSFRELSST